MNNPSETSAAAGSVVADDRPTEAPPPAGEQRPEASTPMSLKAPPAIETALAPQDVLRRLDRLAASGNLPGFEAADDGRGFTVAVFGESFDRQLRAAVTETAAGGARIESSVRLLLKLPLIYTVTIALAIWPGVRLTDALIPAWWGWIPTWQWYLPLLILPLPFALRSQIKRSNKAAREHLAEQIERIRAAVDGRSEPQAPARG